MLVKNIDDMWGHVNEMNFLTGCKTHKQLQSNIAYTQTQ